MARTSPAVARAFPGALQPEQLRGSNATCRVLNEDADLADVIPPGRRERATDECLTRLIVVREGNWSALGGAVLHRGIGLLVLDGMLIRRVGVDGRYGAELLGQGDLLRPWEGEDEPPTLPVTTGWRVIQTTRMAVLDEAVAQRMSRYPELQGRLVSRALQRSRNLAVNMAIVHQPRVEKRLHMLLWHLAGRWGKVCRDGVHVPLTITHSVLADLTAARRPTVSSALTDLATRGLVDSLPDGWLLHGPPPGELLHISPLPSSLTATPVA